MRPLMLLLAFRQEHPTRYVMAGVTENDDTGSPVEQI
jgi:hypothetical protein